jgi:hypothetical protein
VSISRLPEIEGDERIDMFNTPDTSATDQQAELAARIDRRRQTAKTAVAAFGGDRLALVAAVARRARTARDVSPSESATTRVRAGRAASTARPLLAD